MHNRLTLARKVRFRTSSLVAAMAISAWMMNSAQASSIAWTVATIAGDSDVLTAGCNLVRAANLGTGTGAASVTINGVNFVLEATSTPAPLVLNNGDLITRSDTANTGGTFQGFVNTSVAGSPVTFLSDNYRQMLTNAFWNDGTNGTPAAPVDPALTSQQTLTLNNLTIGGKYVVQLWSHDSRISNLGGINPSLGNTVSDGTNTVMLDHNTHEVLGGLGQYAIGRFTADAVSQDIVLTGVGDNTIDGSGNNVTSLLNGYQLRLVPEPASLSLLALGGLIGLGLRLR